MRIPLRSLPPVTGIVAGLGLAATPVPGQVSLSEQTTQAGLSAVHVPVELTIPGARERMIGGLAVGDFDNDGDQDVFWLSGGGAPDKLFINDGSGVFTDEAAAWGLTDLHCGSGASAADYDGDGNVDIFVTSFGPPLQPALPGRNRLYRNTGEGSFVDVAVDAGVNYTSPTHSDGYGSAWGDYDLDGDLDLFVTTHSTGFGNPVPSNGNRLYRNDGDGTFTDVTDASGIGATVEGVRAFQPCFIDVDGDLYPELLLAADFFTNRYYVNDGDGTFTDLTGATGTGSVANGMGQAVADLDNDGHFDWYVTSIHLEQEWNPIVPGTGNMLYMGQGGHQFGESSVSLGVNDGGWGWGTQAVDLDHDGLQELLEVNGWPIDVYWINEGGKLFVTDGNGSYTDMAVAAGFNSPMQGRALARLDADLDGDQDIIVTNFLGPVQYFENESVTGNWLRVEFDTSLNPLLPPNGYGTRVTATAGGESYLRYLSGDPGFLSTSELTLHFGLGDAPVIDELSIQWSRGQVTLMSDVEVNRHVQIIGPRLGDLDLDGVVGIVDFLNLFGHWGAVTTTPGMIADLDADGTVGIADLLILLGAWT